MEVFPQVVDSLSGQVPVEVLPVRRDYSEYVYDELLIDLHVKRPVHREISGHVHVTFWTRVKF